MTAAARAVVDANVRATERLRALVGTLDEAALARPVGGGWTVATVLAHLAFWDRRQREALREYAEDGAMTDEDHHVNAALEPLLLALPPRASADQALAAATAVDAAIAELTPRATDAVLAGPHAYVMRRSAHRDEHIQQIEQALSV